MMDNITTIENPRWDDEEHTAILFDIVLGDGSEGILVARPSDGPTSQYFSKALNGGYGPIAEYAEPAPVPEPVPREITPRQLRIGLVVGGFITETEAREWRKGDALPAPVRGVINAMPVEQQFAAEETAFSMSTVYREDPLLVEAVKAVKPELDEAGIKQLLDQSFRDWSKL